MLPVTTSRRRFISVSGLMIFFFTLADGLLSYIIPVRITLLGFSATKMGLIIASSSVFGAIFDFVLARLIKNTNYRRFFLIAYILCLIFSLIVYSSSTLPLFLLSMAIWGLYSDLHTYAVFDFVGRSSLPKEHCKNFGILGIFKSLGYLIAPIIGGLIVADLAAFFPFSLSLSFTLIAIFFCLILISLSPRHPVIYPGRYRFHFLSELQLLKNIGTILFPVLIFTSTIYIFDAVFWTIGPVFSEKFTDFPDFGGFFMAAYTLPVLIVNWFVGPITGRFGKKKTAYISFLLSSLFLLPVSFVHQPLLIIILVFLSSTIGSVAWPAINGAYADYISESGRYSKEIESLLDLSCNLGYIIGPVFGGIVADVIGIQNVFSALTVLNIFVVIFLLFVTPKHITVKIKS